MIAKLGINVRLATGENLSEKAKLPTIDPRDAEARDMHLEMIRLHDGGKTYKEIASVFEEKGHKIIMADSPAPFK